MKNISGNTGGLKAGAVRRIENLYNHRIPPESVISPELAGEICSISAETRRQIGLLVARSGKIARVIVGDNQKILLPDTSEYRTPPGRLKGLRCIHTHLNDETLTRDDLTDLTLLRLDMMAAITATREGKPEQMHIAHILPSSEASQPHRILDPVDPMDPQVDCAGMIRAIEDELSQHQATREVTEGKERAVLVSVTTASRARAQASLTELRELARSSGIEVLDTIVQHRKKINPRFLMGTGKLEELTIHAMQTGATLIVFDQELNPSQMRSITDQIEFRVLDRTQLILDIFAQRAQSREGKIQVELAQLKYLLPRLVFKNTAMSRLTGGIGGRGPGETKLEINRRRVRDRITRLEKALGNVKKQRKQQKARRAKRGLPVISIIGYTNAGKSTLLNTLTHSQVLAESRLFATLDPSSRRLKFPKDTEVIITDTVGFIQDLPKELRVAFRATLEELENADLLLHVIDASNPDCLRQMQSVHGILQDLGLDRIPVLNVLNKQDRVDAGTMEVLAAKTNGIAITATKAQTLHPLIEKMEQVIAGEAPGPDFSWPSDEAAMEINPLLTDTGRVL
ncbi:GTP-binding protein HflX [Desulfosalsimonas propionicica]|uniref:GTPase HflX n=1 Tax=Desulfosalsimonas propionicica TaxID=332175 RepID=A0A7W0C9V9_9BACT|nr:GTPase HflX [Desulfosalsimonas propionicica]MBA2881785.1 GTP-binding protein HflX [Desulfosalsimonas propionicica]